MHLPSSNETKYFEIHHAPRIQDIPLRGSQKGASKVCISSDVWYQWDWGLVGLMDGHIASSRALAAIAYNCPAYITVMAISSWYRHGGYRHSLVGPWAINMLPSPRPICFPLYSIRSQQEANSTSFSSRPPYIRVYSIFHSRSMPH